MEILLLGIYSVIVWLIFIKLKWLPWNTGTQVTVVIIPIVGLTAMILVLNIVAPSTPDVRFRIDPTPYDLAVRALEAQLAGGQASSRELDEQLVGAGGKVTETRGA